MNWLAHLVLSERDTRARLGNLLADLVRKRERAHLAEPYQRGFALHQRIDRFTDVHPRFLASKRRLRFEHDLFHGILVDLFYDHFLARQFPEYAGLPLADFTADVYRSFETHRDEIPAEAAAILGRMAHEDWLGSYARIDGIEHILERMSRRVLERTGRVISLAAAVSDLRHAYHDLEADFAAFFPEIRAYVQYLP